MIKIGLALLFLGLGIVAWGFRVDQHSQIDDPKGLGLFILGAILVAIAVLLLVGYALYKAFGS